jgi:Phage integrase family
VTKAGTPLDAANVRRAMQSLLKKAKLPLDFTPHCLRHTYASILLAEGVSPVYVQEQLGHATIEMTVSTYGRWLKKRAPGVLDRLDMSLNSKSGSRRQLSTESTDRTFHVQLPDFPWKNVEPATRIERATF